MGRMMRLAGIAGMIVLFSCTLSLAQSNEECQECHDDPEATGENERRGEYSVYVDDELYSNSIHGDLDCIECHEELEGVDFPHDEIETRKVECGLCHEDAVAEVSHSVHSPKFRDRAPDIPGCSDCHGVHDILAVDDPASSVSKANQPRTCAVCHADEEITERNRIVLPNVISHYSESIHSRLIRSGNTEAATCSDCHHGHEILSPLEQHSTIFKPNIPKTCGACHEDALAQYDISLHAQSLNAGNKDAPVCTDCHSEHDILKPENPAAPTHGFNVAIEVCSPCHASERLAKKYGFRWRQVKSFSESYHGLALRGGKSTVANCGSCHGVHDILPSSDPRSRINPANLQETCGACHPNATENFARGSIHFTTELAENKLTYFVRMFYIFLITVTIGFMLIHNSLDFVHRVRILYQKKYPDLFSHQRSE